MSKLAPEMAATVAVEVKSLAAACSMSTLKAAPMGIGARSSLKMAHFWVNPSYQTPRGCESTAPAHTPPGVQLGVTNTRALGSLAFGSLSSSSVDAPDVFAAVAVWM